MPNEGNLHTKKSVLYLNFRPRKSCFTLNLPDKRTDFCNYKVPLLLENDNINKSESQQSDVTKKNSSLDRKVEGKIVFLLMINPPRLLVDNRGKKFLLYYFS